MSCPRQPSGSTKGSGPARQDFRQQCGVPTLLMAQRSTGRMRLQQERAPYQARVTDIDGWPAKFARIANGVHRCRGVEVTPIRILQLSKQIHLSCIVTTLGPLDFSKRWRPPTRFDGPLRDLVLETSAIVSILCFLINLRWCADSHSPWSSAQLRSAPAFAACRYSGGI